MTRLPPNMAGAFCTVQYYGPNAGCLSSEFVPRWYFLSVFSTVINLKKLMFPLFLSKRALNSGVCSHHIELFLRRKQAWVFIGRVSGEPVVVAGEVLQRQWQMYLMFPRVLSRADTPSSSGYVKRRA